MAKAEMATEGAKKTRAVSLDVFRGLAIVGMVLSGQIINWLLPGWMSHAQVPPGQGFTPEIPGITWVDLVFPFFLFAMGAAFPFSVGSRMEKGQGRGKLILGAFMRYLKLAFFAIFISHFYPHWLSSPQDARAWALSIGAFALLFLPYTHFPYRMKPWVARLIEVLGYCACTAALLTVRYANGQSFSLSHSNIIILVLANMSFFGTAIYILTKDKPLLRLAVLPFVMAVLLSTGSWQAKVLNWSPAPWLYQFRFLKYLFIVLPGSIAGEYLREWFRRPCPDASPAVANEVEDCPAPAPAMSNDGRTEAVEDCPAPAPAMSNDGRTEAVEDCPETGDAENDEGKVAGIEVWRSAALVACTVAIVILNLCGLYGRHLALNLAWSVALIGAMYLITTPCRPANDLAKRTGAATCTIANDLAKRSGASPEMLAHLRKFIVAGGFCLLLGLFFENFEDGIRKDPSTFSYYFVTSGLAFLTLMAFHLICDIYGKVRAFKPLSMAGQNPMIAYVSSGMLILPLLKITGAYPAIALLESDPWLGLLRGIIITALAILTASFFTRIRWFWRS